MLVECGLVDRQNTAAILTGHRLEAAGLAAIRPFDHAAEYSYVHVEKALAALVPGMKIIGRHLKLDRSGLAASLDPGSFVQRHSGIGTSAGAEVWRMVKERLDRTATARARVQEKELAIRAADLKLCESAAGIAAGAQN